MKNIIPCSAVLLVAALAGCQQHNPQLDQAANHLVSAREALAAGDRDLALLELNSSIEARPDSWAFYHRARLYAETSEESAALADCESGLRLDPQHADLLWLREELKKPSAQRFKGTRADSPSITK